MSWGCIQGCLYPQSWALSIPIHTSTLHLIAAQVRQDASRDFITLPSIIQPYSPSHPTLYPINLSTLDLLGLFVVHLAKPKDNKEGRYGIAISTESGDREIR